MAFGKKNKNQEPTITESVSSNNNPVYNNSNYRTFSKINNDIATIVNSKSVITKALQQQNIKVANPICQISFDNNFLAMPVATNKQQRIAMYRQIASYPVCKWCLDEIADDFIHCNENNEFITLKLPERLNQIQQNIIQNEFKKYINLFNLKDDGFNLVKRFLIEGELAWENIINPKYPELGIIGIKFLPAEYYETLLDTITAKPVGIVFDTEQFANTQRQMFSNSFAGSAMIFNAMSPSSYNFNFMKNTSIPLLWNQITYINSGEYSYDYLISYPILENVKQQYHRLSLLEDAAVILRVTRAPERLLFNVSTGKMTQNYADEYVRRFAHSLKSKKVATSDGNDVMSVYDAPTMLKHYVFGKSDGNDGTTVESVGSSASYDEMSDIEHFLRSVIKQFKVPWSRYKTPENTMEKNDAISYEEYTFSRMIMRYQRRFADGFKRGFITHLKLRDLWEKEGYDFIESDLTIEFEKPVLYDLYEIQKLVEAKMAIYRAFAEQESISKISVLKKYLGFTDDDIDENYKNLIKEKQLIAVGEYFAELISDENPPVDFKSPIRLKKDVEAEEKINSGLQKDDDKNNEESDDSENTESDSESDMPEPEPPGESSFGLG